MRFSMDISDDIHKTIKTKCAKGGVTMRDYIMNCVARDLESNHPVSDRDARFKAAKNKAITENRDAIRRLADK